MRSGFDPSEGEKLGDGQGHFIEPRPCILWLAVSEIEEEEPEIMRADLMERCLGQVFVRTHAGNQRVASCPAQHLQPQRVQICQGAGNVPRLWSTYRDESLKGVDLLVTPWILNPLFEFTDYSVDAPAAMYSLPRPRHDLITPGSGSAGERDLASDFTACVVEATLVRDPLSPGMQVVAALLGLRTASSRDTIPPRSRWDFRGHCRRAWTAMRAT